MTTETIWGSLPKGKGLGEKKVLIKTLEDTDFASVLYTSPTGVVVTLSELEKVDFAMLEVMSSEAFNSGNVIAKAVAYSGNTLMMKLLRNTSNNDVNDATQILDDTQASGTEISGIIVVRAFIIGEPKEGVA